MNLLVNQLLQSLRRPLSVKKATFIAFLVISALLSAFPLLSKPYLFADMGGDSIYGTLPIYIEMANDFFKDISFWSFRMGIGSSTLTHQNFYFDPFNWLFFLLSPRQIPMILVYQQLFKLVATFFVFFKFFNSTFRNSWASAIGATAATLSGYMILWGQFQAFGTAYFFSGLCLWSLHLCLKQGKLVFWTLSVAFFACFSYYFLFMFSFLILAYVLFFHFLNNKKDESLLSKSSPSIICYIIGILIAAPVFIPSVEVALSSPRVGHGNILKDLLFGWEHYISLTLRFFGNATESTVCSLYGRSDFVWSNYYNVPSVSWGIAGLGVFPFVVKKLLSMKNHWIVFVAVSIFSLGLLFPPLASLFYGLSAPTTRWTFTFIIFQIILMTWFFSDNNWVECLNEKNLKIVLLVLVSVLVLTSILKHFAFGCLPPSMSQLHLTFIRPLLFLALFYVLMSSLLKKPQWRPYALQIILCFFVVERSSSFLIDHYDRSLISNVTFKAGNQYFDETSEAIDWLKSYDKSFYRVGKTYINTGFSDPLAYSYFGITGYSSLTHPSSLKFYKYVNGISDFGDSPPNWLNFSIDRPLVLRLLGVKYVLSKGADELDGMYFKLLHEVGLIKIWVSKIYSGNVFEYYERSMSESLPLHLYDRELLISKFGVFEDSKEGMKKVTYRSPYKSQWEDVLVQDLGVANMVLLENNFPKVIRMNALNNDPYLTVQLNKKGFYTSLKISFLLSSELPVGGQIFWTNERKDFIETQSNYFLIRSGRDIPYEVELPYVGEISRLRIDLGGEVNSLEMKNLKVEGRAVSDFNRVTHREIESLTNSHLQLTNTGNKLKLIGSLKEAALVVLSIPFDKAWNIKSIDGIGLVTLSAQNGLLATYLEPGHHSYELVYEPQSFFVSLLLSGFGFFALVLLYLRKKYV